MEVSCYMHFTLIVVVVNVLRVMFFFFLSQMSKRNENEPIPEWIKSQMKCNVLISMCLCIVRDCVPKKKFTKQKKNISQILLLSSLIYTLVYAYIYVCTTVVICCKIQHSWNIFLNIHIALKCSDDDEIEKERKVLITSLLVIIIAIFLCCWKTVEDTWWWHKFP